MDPLGEPLGSAVIRDAGSAVQAPLSCSAVSGGHARAIGRRTDGLSTRHRRQAAGAIGALGMIVILMVLTTPTGPFHHSAARHPSTPGGTVPVRISGDPAALVPVTFPAPADTTPIPSSPATASGDATLGQFGEQTHWVVAENSLPGTTAWQITDPPPPSISIAGYANQVSAIPGETVELYVDTMSSQYQVQAYRMGYYNGTGARLVWQSVELAGQVQPACTLTSGINMVACDDWSPSVSIPITTAFVQGDYLFKLVGSDGGQSYVPLTVTDPTSTAAYLIKNDIYTWQAWNPYGGYDFYAGVGNCGHSYPICSRARVTSFDRPYAYGQGAADFLGNEYPLVEFAEQQGLDVTYATDEDVATDPAILLRHRAVLSLGHDECWSLPERQAAVSAQEAGVNIVFFAASPVLRHVRMQASPLGNDREEVDYRDASEDPLNGHGDPLEVTGNTWSSPPANWSEVSFVGESYAGYLEPGASPVPFVVADPSAWIFKGTGLTEGSSIPGVLLSDFDQYDPGMHPANLEILGHSPIPDRDVQTSRRDIASDMTYYTDPISDAGTLDTGTNNWIPSMQPCGDAACDGQPIEQITGNLLWLFGQGPAGQTVPSVANWQTIY